MGNTTLTGSDYKKALLEFYPSATPPENGVEVKLITDFEMASRDVDEAMKIYSSAKQSLINATGKILSENPQGCLAIFDQYVGCHDGRKDGESTHLKNGKLGNLEFCYDHFSCGPTMEIKTPYGCKIEFDVSDTFEEAAWDFHKAHFNR